MKSIRCFFVIILKILQLCCVADPTSSPRKIESGNQIPVLVTVNLPLDSKGVESKAINDKRQKLEDQLMIVFCHEKKRRIYRTKCCKLTEVKGGPIKWIVEGVFPAEASGLGMLSLVAVDTFGLLENTTTKVNLLAGKRLEVATSPQVAALKLIRPTSIDPQQEVSLEVFEEVAQQPPGIAPPIERVCFVNGEIVDAAILFEKSWPIYSRKLEGIIKLTAQLRDCTTKKILFLKKFDLKIPPHNQINAEQFQLDIEDSPYFGGSAYTYEYPFFFMVSETLSDATGAVVSTRYLTEK